MVVLLKPYIGGVQFTSDLLVINIIFTMQYQWSQIVVDSFQNLWAGVISFVPNLIVALVILLVGWFIGAILGKVVDQVLKSIKLDDALRHAKVEEMLAKGGITLNSGRFVGGLVKWFVIVAFLVASLDVLKLTQVNDFLRDVVLSYLPQVIVAVLILLAAAVIGDIMQRIVMSSAKAAGVHAAGFLGKVTRWSIWIFAILIALSQLGIATALIQTLFTGVVIAVALAIGLSFGLGGQEAAAQFIAKTKQEMTHRG